MKKKISNEVDKIVCDLDNTIFGHNCYKEDYEDGRNCKVRNLSCFAEDIRNFWKCCTKELKNKKVTEEEILRILAKYMRCVKEEDIDPKIILNTINDRKVEYLHEGTEILLRTLKSKDYKIIALTDWFRTVQMQKLEDFGILHYFDEVYGWDNTYAKPDSRNFSRIISEDEKNRYVIIGDSLESDILGAQKIGIKSIWVNTNNKKTKKQIKPTIEVSSLVDIIEMI